VASATVNRSSRDILVFDQRKLFFSLSTFTAAAIVLCVAFMASLPRPWWALLTVYVTAQPMAGAFRPKALYRLTGIAAGAAMTIVLVPNLQNSPALLVPCLSLWIGICIYLAVLDRTPRAFLFQMAAFSTAVISFPYLYDPSDIFTTTISRVEEMSLAIVCVSVAHMILYPTNVRPMIHERALSFLSDASRWTAEALGTHHTRLEYEHRRRLAADVTELGMIAVTLPFDQRYALATRATVDELQHRLASLLSLATAAADRLDRLRALDAVDVETEALVTAIVRMLTDGQDPVGIPDEVLSSECRALAAKHLRESRWKSLLAASFCDRMAVFIDTLHEARLLVQALDESEADLSRHVGTIERAQRFPLSKDHGLALLAGAATTTALILYCTFWISLAWPNGSTTAAFGALVTCSFAAQDDPAPAIWRYLASTLATFPLAALYLFVILPRTDGAGMLILMLAPALIWLGYKQADPARAARALPMLSCFIVSMGFLDRFTVDFAGFLNTGLALMAGIVMTLAVTKLFRSVNVRWTAYRMIHNNWADLEQLADPQQPLDVQRWTAHATDRLGQVAARMALAGPEESLHAADGLSDLRIGRNIIQARDGMDGANEPVRLSIQTALAEISKLYYARMKAGKPLPPQLSLLRALDDAILAAAQNTSSPRNATILALVGMRCNIFPNAQPLKETA
jgi:uncharacterized membrane protein YccC